jgi:DNA polymerase elongation subunit (family B)
VQSFEDEKEMLMAWHKFFMEVDPDIITGYNITQFDIPYLLQRAQVLKLVQFPYFGRIKCMLTFSASKATINFPLQFAHSAMTSAKADLNFSSCPGYEGRILLDVYHHLREYYQGLQGQGAYKLNNVSQRFLNEKKEDIRLQGNSHAPERRRRIAEIPGHLLLKSACLWLEILGIHFIKFSLVGRVPSTSFVRETAML